MYRHNPETNMYSEMCLILGNTYKIDSTWLYWPGRIWTIRNWRWLKKQIQDLVGLPDWRAGAVWNQDTSWLSAFLWQYKSEFIFWGNSLPPLVCPDLTFALLSTLVWSSALFRFHSLISSFFTPVFWSVLFLISFSSCFQFFLFILHSLLLYISPASHLLLFSNLSPSSPLSYCPHLPSPLLSGLEINPQSDNLQLNRQLIPLKAMLRRGGECLHGLQQMRCTSGKLISRPNSQMLQILSIFPPLPISSYFSPPRSLAWFPSEEFFTN